MKTDNKFRKAERLCSKKLIEELFSSGRSFYAYPFRLVWIPLESKLPFNSQLAISVKKKQFKKAVHRNLLKRRIREAYRNNKHSLYVYLQERDIHIAFILIYTSADILTSKEIGDKIIVILDRLRKELALAV